MLRGLLIGGVIGVTAGLGAFVQQTGWLDKPQVEITTIRWEPQRTHEMTVSQWWELEYGNDEDIPDEIEEASIIAGNRFDIAPEIFQAMGETESQYDVDAFDGQSLGWLQVTPKWHAARIADYGLEAEDMYDPTCCALIAGDYLSELLEKYDGDMALALMAYNGHISGIRRYYKTGQMSGYAETILRRSEELEVKHGKK